MTTTRVIPDGFYIVIKPFPTVADWTCGDGCCDGSDWRDIGEPGECVEIVNNYVGDLRYIYHTGPNDEEMSPRLHIPEWDRVTVDYSDYLAPVNKPDWYGEDILEV